MAPIYCTEHFTLILSWKASAKFSSTRGQKLAIVENAYPLKGNLQLFYDAQFDPKKRKELGLPDTIRVGGRTKRIIKVWPEIRYGGFNYRMRRQRLLGGVWKKRQRLKGEWQFYSFDQCWYHQGEARWLVDKLEKLWPLHFMAKEVDNYLKCAEESNGCETPGN